MATKIWLTLEWYSYSTRFPINRRHQGLATILRSHRAICCRRRFQSIGVTKDWRRTFKASFPLIFGPFPINRRHQGLATAAATHKAPLLRWFPINRRHQGLATESALHLSRGFHGQFPINRRHQGLATQHHQAKLMAGECAFPINRRHQGLATCIPARGWRALRGGGFQSIGVTKDWRPAPEILQPADLDAVSNQ